MKAPCYGIIPARYASSRLPGKALALIAGKPMFWHVYNRAVQCEFFTTVTLATDDMRIAEVAKDLGVPHFMTRADHQSGTDRVHEVAQKLAVPQQAVVVNIQGDEPELDPLLLHELVEPFSDPLVRVSTLVTVIGHEQASSPNQVKVVSAQSGDALYFSRAVVPFARDGEKGQYLGHIGVYAFRKEALDLFTSLGPSPLEQIEKLEQLRFLENGIPIRLVHTARHSQGVDTEEDLARVRQRFAEGTAETSSAPKERS